MGFADNLKYLRKQHHLTQEELADHLEVSRQAISKWESSAGYPEIETLLKLSKLFQVSLDEVMGEVKPDNHENYKDYPVSGAVTIETFDHSGFVTCRKAICVKLFHKKERKNYANYALFGIEGRGFWGGSYTLVSLYKDKAEADKEVAAILQAIRNGIPLYKIQYADKVKQHRGKFLLINEDVQKEP